MKSLVRAFRDARRVFLCHFRRRAPGIWATLRNAHRALSYHRLKKTDFPSGLGDVGWLLYGLVRLSRPEVCVEIGSASGKSACFIGMALRENHMGKLYAIDPHRPTTWNDPEAVDSYPMIQRNLRRFGVQERVEIVRATSEEAARSWHAPIDVLFIDGDHSYEGVKGDWERFSPFVKPSGIVVFHDTLWDLDARSARDDREMGVPRFVDELRQQGYPVITLERDFPSGPGMSLVQPVRNGIPLIDPR